MFSIKITDAGLKAWPSCSYLEWLDLSHNKITDAGLKEVAKLQNLKLLDLTETQTTKAGIAELKKALPNCEITGP